MQAEKWNAIIGRISDRRAEDIDDLTMPFDTRAKSGGRALFPDVVAPLSLFRGMASDDVASIGILVSERHADLAATALRLGALGLEHDVEVIALTVADYSGLECFGFRSERICGESEAQQRECEAQVRAFWGIDLLV